MSSMLQETTLTGDPSVERDPTKCLHHTFRCPTEICSGNNWERFKVSLQFQKNVTGYFCFSPYGLPFNHTHCPLLLDSTLSSEVAAVIHTHSIRGPHLLCIIKHHRQYQKVLSSSPSFILKTHSAYKGTLAYTLA